MNKMWWLNKLNILKIVENEKPSLYSYIKNIIKVNTYPPKQIIYSSDLTGDCIYIINSGIVELFKISSQNTRINITQLSVDDIFGKLSIIQEGETGITVQSKTELQLYILRQTQIEKIIKENNELGTFIFSKIEQEINKIWSKINETYINNVSQRFLRFLSKIINNYEYFFKETNKLQAYRLINKEFVKLFNIKKELIDDVINFLINKNLIYRDNDNIFLKN